MTDNFTAAWEEAEAAAPPNVTIYGTLEVQHPVFDQPARVVANVPNDVDLTLEAGAAFNGGETVTFTAVEVTAERPEFSEGKTPECSLTIDNVGRLLVPQLNDAVAVRADLTVIYREYRSDDTSEPCYGPVEFKLRQVSMQDTRLTGIARVDDLANRKFPSRVYTIREFPGLVPI
jgi:hypothetical protein